LSTLPIILVAPPPKDTPFIDATGRITLPWLGWLGTLTSIGVTVSDLTGAVGGALVAALNLADLTDAVTARLNLGLGTAAVHAAADFDASGAAAAAQAAAILASLARSANLSDLANVITARLNLGLGSAATTPATDYDVAGAASAAYVSATLASLQRASNLSDLTNAVTARTNLGLGSAATQPSTAFDLAGAAAAAQAAAIAASDAAGAAAAALAAAIAASLQRASNLSDLANAVTARTNLGLGTAATTAATAYDVAGAANAAQAAAILASAQRASNLSDLASAVTARTNLGLGAAALLATPIPIASGGTGAATLLAANIAVINAANIFGAFTQTFGGNLLFSTDSTYNIGANAATRPLTVYAAGGGGFQAGATTDAFFAALTGNALAFNRSGTSYVQQLVTGGSFALRMSRAAQADTTALFILSTGQVGVDMTTSPTTALQVNGSISTIALATPAAPTVTPTGTAGATAYSYVIVAKQADGSLTIGGAVGSTATGNATLDVTNYNALSWAAVTNAASYDVYRTVGGATQGRIATAQTALTLNDTGLAASGAVPTVSTSGGVTAAAYRVGATAGASGTLTIPKLTTANGSLTFVNGIITAFVQPT
jgi:hypothetical protein